MGHINKRYIYRLLKTKQPRSIDNPIRRPGADLNWQLVGRAPYMQRLALGNRLSTFPLAAKLVVTVTTKLAIPKGHRAGDVRRWCRRKRKGRGREWRRGWRRARRRGDINSHNILRGGIWPVSSPSDAQEYGLGVITPNHPKTCSREQFSRYQGGRSLLNTGSLPEVCGCPSLWLPLFSVSARRLSYHVTVNLTGLSVMNCPSDLQPEFLAQWTLSANIPIKMALLLSYTMYIRNKEAGLWIIAI